MEAGRRRANWYETAEALERDAAGVQHGERVAEAAKWGISKGVAPQTLRTYALARRFLLRIQTREPDLALRLRSAPAIAAETLARWHKRDEAGALEAAALVAHEAMSIRELNVLEAESGNDWPARNKRAVVESVLAGRSGEDCRRPSATERRAKVDLVFRDVPVMVVGPYSTDDQYYYLAPEWMLKGMGLARIYGVAAPLIPRVVLDLGSKDSVRGYLTEQRGVIEVLSWPMPDQPRE
jgi:hypothetical protein